MRLDLDGSFAVERGKRGVVEDLQLTFQRALEVFELQVVVRVEDDELDLAEKGFDFSVRLAVVTLLSVATLKINISEFSFS